MSADHREALERSFALELIKGLPGFDLDGEHDRATARQNELRRREAILEVERRLRADPDVLTAADFRTFHHFAPGQYAREIELPAGSCVVGKIHRHAHVNVVSKGRCIVATPGDDPVEIVAPATFISKPGTKRVVLAITDVVWTTVHVTNETDLERIEAEIIAPTFAALEGEGA